MDVILLFMRLEDKYWGLFFAGLFFLLVYKKHEECRYTRFFALYAIFAYVLFVMPPVFWFVQKFVPSLSEYYELSHMELVVPVLVVAGTLAVTAAKEEGKMRGAGLLAGLFVILLVAGQFAYTSPEMSRGDMEELHEAYELLLTHADSETEGAEEKLHIWGMKDFMSQSRLYSARFCPVYGKDIAEYPERYSQAQQMLYQGYASYDTEGGTAINIEDVFHALAALPTLYPEIECDYIAVYDPALYFEDYKEYFGKKEFDSVGCICYHGYEYVGRTEHLLLFAK